MFVDSVVGLPHFEPNGANEMFQNYSGILSAVKSHTTNVVLFTFNDCLVI